MNHKFLLLFTEVAILAATVQPALTFAQQPATITDEDQISAVVESVNKAERSILLHGPQGGLVTIVAGPEVRNFGQIKPGDRVNVTYREALAASVAKPGTSMPPLQVTEREGPRAQLGEKPRGSAEQMTRARVIVTALDLRHNVISFIGPAQVERTVDVVEPEMQRFIHTLKVGDQVDVTYTEAIAARVEPAGQS